MTQISNLIEQNEILKAEAIKKSPARFFLDISQEDFMNLFCSKLNYYLSRKHKKDFKFKIDKQNKEIIEQLYFYLYGSEQFKGDLYKGILLIGSLGTGKTTILQSFCEMINDFKIKIISIIHSKKLSSELNADKNIIEYEKIPLFIDDIGKENRNVNNFGTIINPIPDIFALRSEYGSWTFGTGNYNLNSYSEFYGETIKERFFELFNIISVSGESRRKQDIINIKN